VLTEGSFAFEIDAVEEIGLGKHMDDPIQEGSIEIPSAPLGEIQRWIEEDL
jgi:hypothetical protein